MYRVVDSTSVLYFYIANIFYYLAILPKCANSNLFCNGCCCPNTHFEISRKQSPELIGKEMNAFGENITKFARNLQTTTTLYYQNNDAVKEQPKIGPPFSIFSPFNIGHFRPNDAFVEEQPQTTTTKEPPMLATHHAILIPIATLILHNPNKCAECEDNNNNNNCESKMGICCGRKKCGKCCCTRSDEKITRTEDDEDGEEQMPNEGERDEEEAENEGDEKRRESAENDDCDKSGGSREKSNERRVKCNWPCSNGGDDPHEDDQNATSGSGRENSQKVPLKLFKHFFAKNAAHYGLFNSPPKHIDEASRSPLTKDESFETLKERLSARLGELTSKLDLWKNLYRQQKAMETRETTTAFIKTVKNNSQEWNNAAVETQNATGQGMPLKNEAITETTTFQLPPAINVRGTKITLTGNELNIVTTDANGIIKTTKVTPTILNQLLPTIPPQNIGIGLENLTPQAAKFGEEMHVLEAHNTRPIAQTEMLPVAQTSIVVAPLLNETGTNQENLTNTIPILGITPLTTFTTTLQPITELERAVQMPISENVELIHVETNRSNHSAFESPLPLSKDNVAKGNEHDVPINITSNIPESNGENRNADEKIVGKPEKMAESGRLLSIRHIKQTGNYQPFLSDMIFNKSGRNVFQVTTMGIYLLFFFYCMFLYIRLIIL